MALRGDVIELGSSDDEVEPASKKKKPQMNKKKPPLNAMVHIPSKLPGVTIKPTNKKNKTNLTRTNIEICPIKTIISPSNSRSKINPINIAKGSIGKGVTVTKVPINKTPISKVANPFATIKPNGNPKIVSIKSMRNCQLPVGNAVSMPVIQTMNISRQPANKIVVAKGVSTAPVIKPIGALPAGITVKRTCQLAQPGQKRKVAPIVVNRQAKRTNLMRIPANNPNEIVNLDDDDGAPSAALGPQWYLRPEEQTEKSTTLKRKSSDDVSENKNSPEEATPMELEIEVDKNTTEGETSMNLEKQNNKEPEAPKFIEITIEDSPAKPQSKRACGVADMSITVDDSPVKNIAEKEDHHSGSDHDTTPPEKHSKKKLEYPKIAKTVEIEIEFTPVESVDPLKDDKNDSQDDVVGTEIVEIEESPIKPAEKVHTSTPKKKSKPQVRLTEINTIEQTKTTGEFHPIYQSFIDLCFQLENSEDMSKIVDKKIKAYYRQVPKEYTESEAFIDMVGSKISAMKAGPEKMYLYIKDVVDELNLQRKVAKSQPVKLDTVNEEQEKFLYGEESEFDAKRQRQIRKLEKTLKKLHRAIQKLEEQEVDFDDEEDSVYLLTESCEEGSKEIVQPLEKAELLKRYKERMIRVHAKFCQLTNTKMPSEPRVQIDARPGQPKGPAKRLEKWINKKVPIGTPLPFPDFHDVLRCVRDANQEDKLGWNEADIMEEARDLFTRCGKKLQRRRQENEWRLAASRIQQELDPVEESEDLKKKLEDNRRVASKKESELLNKYADRQNQLNLEAVEIGDKEADESPVETDDDEPTEEKSSLESKEKRKERLKRLLQKNSKKLTDGRVTEDIASQPHVEFEKPNNLQSEVRDKVAKDKEVLETNKTSSETENKEKKSETNKLENPSDKSIASDENAKDPLADEYEKEQIPSDSNEKEDKAPSDSEKVHSLSDDSNKIDSDIDELHLLQKLHSDEINSSTLESSDSESPIAISDSLSSDNKKQASDVISIENSSYSESEKNEEREIESCSRSKVTMEAVSVQLELKTLDTGVEKTINKSNNEEYNESIEDILLASSDDETNTDEPARSTDKTNTEYQSKYGDTKQVNNKTSDNTDAILIDSIEMAAVKKNVDSNATNIDNSIDPTDICDSEENKTVDKVITAMEVPITSSVDEIMTNAKNGVEIVKSRETIEEPKTYHKDIQADSNIDNSCSNLCRIESVDSVEDTVMKTVEVSGDTVEETNIKSADIVDDVTTNTDKAVKIISREVNSTESMVDPKANDEGLVPNEVEATETKNDKSDSSKDNKKESCITDDISKVNNGDVIEKDKSTPEAMEVDVVIDKT